MGPGCWIDGSEGLSIVVSVIAVYLLRVRGQAAFSLRGAIGISGGQLAIVPRQAGSSLENARITSFCQLIARQMAQS